jgi:hypothetical protein
MTNGPKLKDRIFFKKDFAFFWRGDRKSLLTLTVHHLGGIKIPHDQVNAV